MGVFKDGAYYPLGTGGEVSEGEYQAYLEEGLWEDELSEHAQDARDHEDEGGLDADVRRANLESFLDGPFPGEWTVRGGTIMKIAKMTISHLDNAIRYFEREDLGDHPKIQELREERKRR